MKRITSFLVAAGLLVSVFQSPSAFAVLPGCHNDVLKQGYDYHLTVNHLAGLTAIHYLNREHDGVALSDEVMERVRYLIYTPAIQTPRRDNVLALVWNRYITPLETKGFLDKLQFNGRQGVLVNDEGLIAARKNFITFYEAHAARAKRLGKKPKALGELKVGPAQDATNIDLSLADYLVLSQFKFGEDQGSTEVYNAVSGQLSYYATFQPSSPSIVTAKLRTFAERGWLRFTDTDYRSRRRGGSLYKYTLTYPGILALNRLENVYMQLLSSWLDTDTANGHTELREKIKELKR